jgi:lactoylglutathione lyase
MATGSEAVKVADEAVLEWNKHDSKRMLRAVYRVGDLDCTPSGLSTTFLS